MATQEKTAAASDLHIETAGSGINRMNDVDITDKTLNAEALEATAAEHSLGFIQGFKTYKRAAFWSIRESILGVA